MNDNEVIYWGVECTCHEINFTSRQAGRLTIHSRQHDDACPRGQECSSPQ